MVFGTQLLELEEEVFLPPSFSTLNRSRSIFVPPLQMRDSGQGANAPTSVSLAVRQASTSLGESVGHA